MRIVVTGAGGYLGAVLTQRLLSVGHEVTGVDALLHGGDALRGIYGTAAFEFVEADVRDANDMEEVLDGVDAVVHLAAIVGDPACARDPEAAVAVNRDASLGLARIAAEAGVDRFIFASTCSNYGRMADTSQLATEEDELRPISLYSETKVEVELDLLARRAGIDATVMRFSTLYGLAPRMRFDLTVNQFVLEMYDRKELLVFGEKFWRPYVHVRDAAAAVHAVLEADARLVASEVFNVGATAENFRKIDIVEMISKRLPDVSVEFVHRDEDPRDYRVAFEKISERLGFKPSMTVSDGIDEMLGALQHRLISDPYNAYHYNVPVGDVL